MNLLPTYEQIISDRQDDIEIPDMADAIWGRVEALLDVEMPVHDTPAAPEGKPFFKDPAVWIICAGIIAIIIALFFLNRKPAPTPQHLPQQTMPAIQPDTAMKQDFKPPPDTVQSAPEKKIRPINKKQVVDTTAQNVLMNVKTDSLLKPQPVIVAPPAIKIPPAGTLNPPIDIKPRPKYGVVVSDSDYRFNVKPKN